MIQEPPIRWCVARIPSKSRMYDGLTSLSEPELQWFDGEVWTTVQLVVKDEHERHL